VLVQAFLGDGEGRVASYVAMGVLIVMSPYFILKRILGHDRVTVQTLLGAVSVYVMIGLTFAFVYGALAALHGPGSFNGATPTPETLLYFSFVTMTTVGYGDVTAATDLIRTVAILEALLGQVFLVTLVARLVSLFGQPMRHLPPEDG
jgi:voltage-gated potassium channel Kch